MAEGAPTPMTTARDRAVIRATEWIRATTPEAEAKPPSRLRAFLADAEGRTFAFGAVDSVFRPDSLSAAAAHYHRLAPSAPAELPWLTRSVIRASGAMAPVLPSPVVPAVRSAMRSLIADITTDARPKKLAAALAQSAATDTRLELTLPALAARSDDEARTYRERLIALIARDDVTAVTFRLPQATVVGDLWDYADQVESAVRDVTELYVAAAAHRTRLLLEVREVRELDLALSVLTDVLEADDGTSDAGISMSAALADSHDSVQQLGAWARQRAAATPITIRLTDAEASGAERDENLLNGWPQPALTGRIDILAALVRGLEELTTFGRAVRASVATHDPFVLAYVMERAPEAELVMQAGVTPEWESVIAAAMTEATSLTRTTLVVNPREVDAVADAIAERLSAAALALDDASITQEQLAAHGAEIVQRAQTNPILSRRALDRSAEIDDVKPDALLRPIATDTIDLTQAVMGIAHTNKPTSALDTADLIFGGTPYVETAIFSEREGDELAAGATGFRNAQTTDPSFAANREWALATESQRVPEESTRWQTPADAVVMIRHGHGEWEGLSAADRAGVLERAAHQLEARRSDLIVAARPTGVVFADADRDVTAAVDFARYYAATVRELDATAGAIFVPAGISMIAGASADVIASAAEGALASLAAGGAAVMLARPHEQRVIATLAEALWQAGVPRDALCVAAGTAADAADTANVDSIVMSGTIADVHEVAHKHEDLAVNARVHGRNTMIVAPSADVDEAAAALVTSAFSRDGAAFESISLAILCGAIARSDRLSTALVALTTAWAQRAERRVQAREARGETRHVALTEDDLWALTTLEVGQDWLVQPRELSDGTYTPGIRVGVESTSRFASERFAAPVLGILSAGGVGAATALANTLSTGAVASLQTSDAADAEQWLRHAEAGSLYIDRASVNPVVQRQPSGGWHGAAVGPAAKVGGPNRLVTLGTWRPTAGHTASATLHLRGLDSRVTMLIEAAQPDLDFDDFEWVRRAALSDALVWDREFGHIRDVTRLGIERNLFRYRPSAIAIRACAETPVRVVLRLVIAAVRSQAEFTLSTAEGLPAHLRRALGDAGVTLFVESDAEFVQRAVVTRIPRVRLTGANAADTAAAIRVQSVVPVATFSHPATTVGRVELLAYLREQTVSIGGRSVAAFADVI